MEEIVQTAMVGLYKIAGLATSLTFGWMGYSLFRLGIFGKSGDAEFNWKDTKIVLKKAAPGTFFAVLGAALAIAVILKGFTIS